MLLYLKTQLKDLNSLDNKSCHLKGVKLELQKQHCTYCIFINSSVFITYACHNHCVNLFLYVHCSLTGSSVPDLIVSMSNQMWLHLQSDDTIGSQGFKAIYEGTSHPSYVPSSDVNICIQGCYNFIMLYV